MKRLVFLLFVLFLLNVGFIYAETLTSEDFNEGTFDIDDQKHYNIGSLAGYKEEELRIFRKAELTHNDNNYLHVRFDADQGDLTVDTGSIRSYTNLKRDSTIEFQERELISLDITVEAPNRDEGGTGFFDKDCSENTCKLIDYTEVEVGNRKYKLYDGSRLIYEKGEDGNPDEVRIIHPPGKEITAPEKIDSDIDDNPIINYNVNDPKGHLVLPGNNKISRFNHKFDFSIGYDTKVGAFFSDNAARIENFNINSLRSDKVYLYFDDVAVPPTFEGSYLKILENEKMEMFSSDGSDGYSIEFVGFDKTKMKAYGGIKLDAAKEGANVWYVHGKGQTPEGKEFSGDSRVEIDPSKSTSEKRVVKTEGSFSHINRNRFIHLNENLNQQGPRDYYFKQKIKIGGGGDNFIERDFTSTELASTITQIDFADSLGNPIKFKGKDDEIIDLKHSIFIDNKGQVLRPRNEKEQGLLANAGFFDLEEDIRNEAMVQLFEGKSVKEILGGKGFVEKLKKSVADRAAKKVAEEKARQDALQNNVPPQFRNIPIGDDLVEGLDNAVNDGKTGIFVRNKHKGASKVIAISLVNHGCGACVQWMNNIRNPGGNVYELVDNILVRNAIKKDHGIDLKGVTSNPPSTIFIDTETKKVVGFESPPFGSYTPQETFNSYFK